QQPESVDPQPLPPALGPDRPDSPRPLEHADPHPTAPAATEVPTGPPLTLPDAIALAYQRQPRLRVYMESIQQAKGLSDLAFAPFLPMVTGGYSVGGFDLNVGGQSVHVGNLPGFTVLPPAFALPVGLNIQTSYELAELRLQWLICDFGRRMGRYN